MKSEPKRADEPTDSDRIDDEAAAIAAERIRSGAADEREDGTKALESLGISVSTARGGGPIGLALIATLLALLLAGCGGSRYGPGPTADIEACLKGAGAKIATDAGDLAFAEGGSYRTHEDGAGLDQSRTLSVGAYRSPGKQGWELYYVVRKGYRLGFDQIVRHPDKAAKVVAYVHPFDQATVNAAGECL